MSTAELVQTAAEAIARGYGLGSTVARYPTGSVPVFSAENCVIKLFPGSEWSHFATECAALQRVHDGLSIPTPQLLAHGRQDDWHFVLMSRLSGSPLAEHWPALSDSERRSLVHTVGRAMRELHALPTTDLPALETPWTAFLAAQRAGAGNKQRGRGLSESWLEQIDPFLADHPLEDAPLSILHTEVMREHLLVEPDDRGWRLTGLVDFEPAMIGAAGYEFASLGVFVTGGDAVLWDALAQGYGDTMNPLEVMSYALLHRYSNLRWYLERVPPPAHVRDLDALARYWFGGREHRHTR